MTTLSVFPKFLRSLAAEALGDRLAACGLDAVDLVVRDGFWTPAEDLSASVPAFRTAVAASGLGCTLATWADDPEQFRDRGDALRALADNGITAVRIGYFGQTEGESYPAAFARAQAVVDQLATIAQASGLRLVLQVHHGRLVTNPESAALLVANCDPAAIGVMLDVGNQGHEGHCNYQRAASILGPWWTDLGVKDVAISDRQRAFAACQHGTTDWRNVVAGWRQAPRLGLWDLQPFYHASEPDQLLATLRDEVTWLRQHLIEAAS